MGRRVLRRLSQALAALSVALIAWGGYGVASFPDDGGAGCDPRFFVFDNSYYALVWGLVGLGASALSGWVGRRVGTGVPTKAHTNSP
jgi:hypothetical protein